jgi:hypothetical protein
MSGREPASEEAKAMIDRTEVNRALAKALAYKACGKDHKADQWAAKLVKLLEANRILSERGEEMADEAA